MIPPAPRILPECLGGAGNCAGVYRPRLARAFSFAGRGSFSSLSQNGGAGCLRTHPTSLLDSPASSVAPGFFAGE